ncbi:glycosyltransferase [Acinetobacter ursingii]|uniref:glycosyltransferase n=1 Tax=Acinetobacter ursingii TaxID=108980 RepID=UPI001269DFCF|nr:glycosyltransferase [Acinetobacter ursingii]
MHFSVLLSLYNKENPLFLDQCLSSIWSDQSRLPSEIVLVIDGPIGDALEEKVMYWKNNIGDAFKIIQLRENVGLGKALNEGLKHCANEWIFRMDTDDICTPDRFEKQVAFIQENPDIVLFSGQVIEFDQDISNASILKAVPVGFEEIKKFAQKRCPFNHMAVAYRKSIIEELGSYQHHLFMEDYNLWLRVIGAGYKVGNLTDVIVYARVGNGMHARRKGFQYIKSEKQLRDLKKQLKLQSAFHANMLFVVRSMFRLMPTTLLSTIYNMFLRKRTK